LKKILVFVKKKKNKKFNYLPIVKGDYIKDINKNYPENLKLNLFIESIVKKLT
jgi:hypothetical protein